MSTPGWLPSEFSTSAFSVTDAENAGISQARRDSSRLLRPFTGVRSTRPSASIVERAQDYRVRLKRKQVFAGISAVRLLGLPWIHPWSLREPLELAVPRDHYMPRSRGVQSHRLAPGRLQTVEIHGLPVLSPIAAVMDVADRLDVEELAGLFDALLTESNRYPNLLWRPMSPSLDDIEEGVEAWGPGPSRTRARAALPYVRGDVDSYPESRTRVFLVRNGLPEPSRQPPVSTRIGILHPDAGWEDYRVCFEYEGEHHRTDEQQWHSDIARFEALAAAGWMTLRVTARDLRPGYRGQLLVRATQMLRDRGWIGGSVLR